MESREELVNSYTKYTPDEHAYNVSDMWVGDDLMSEREEHIYDIESKRIIEEKLDTPPAVERLFLEVLSNALDNTAKSIREGIKVPPITVTMNERTISVKNGGVPIPIEINKESGSYIPEMVFGEMFSGRNFNDKREDGGRNGLGVKLVNIFSTRMKVIVCDKIAGKKITLEWSNNMQNKKKPKLEEFNGESLVYVEYDMDFERFNYKSGYRDFEFGLFARHCVDGSFTLKVPIIFNEEALNFSDPREYAGAYFGEITPENHIMHYEWPEGTTVTKHKNGTYVGWDEKKKRQVLPMVEFCAVDTPDNGNVVSFANSINTKEGGVHVTSAIKVIATSIIDQVNGSYGVEKTKKKGSEKKLKKEECPKVTLKDVNPHLSLVITCRVTNPKFNGQTKTMLRGPVPKITLNEKELREIANWNLVQTLEDTLKQKISNASRKTDGKKKRYINPGKGEDANKAGTSESGECKLYIVEGLSAMGYAVKMFKHIEGGRDYNGIYPMKGKPLNAMNAPEMKATNNEEFIGLKKYLGLKDKTDYTDPDEFETLRYGSVVILADSDVDGKHIMGLITLFFEMYYPSLLEIGYVQFLRTPILCLFKGKKYHKFYTVKEYEEFCEKTPDWRKWEPKYYKGLGSSNDKEIAQDSQHPRYVQYIHDENATDALTLAFRGTSEYRDKRKEWIDTWEPNYEIEQQTDENISDFVHHELIQHSIANMQRNIPSLMDGLKDSQRRAICGSFDKWTIYKKKGKHEKIKVSQIASHVASKTRYHHGEKSMNDTMVKMAMTFTGANNLGYFVPDGNYGTRNAGGEDHADPRYIFTCPEWWWPFVFIEDDFPILEWLEDEGKRSVPAYYLPIVPLHVINGANGVGTAYSSFIVRHDIIDAIKCVKALCQGKECPEITPKYNGFTGEIVVQDTRRHRYLEYEDVEIEGYDEEEVKENPILGKVTMVTSGKFHKEKNKVIITELPIGSWTHNYVVETLGKMREEKKIANIRNNSTDTEVYIELTGVKDESLKGLSLIKRYTMGNMVLLDQNNKAQKFDSVPELITKFYQTRLPYYTKRREYKVKQLEREIETLEHKIKFFTAIFDGKLVINLHDEKEFLTTLGELEIPEEIYRNARISNLSKGDIETLKKKVKELKKLKKEIAGTSSEDMWLADLDAFEEAYLAHKDD